jgi:hypothetical protein
VEPVRGEDDGGGDGDAALFVAELGDGDGWKTGVSRRKNCGEERRKNEKKKRSEVATSVES